MSRFTLSRRTLLRGAGVGIALPLLEAMTDGRGRIFTGRAFAAAPKRFFSFFVPNGFIPSVWVPTTPGTGYTLPTALAPFTSLKGDINILSGLNHYDAKGSTNGHYLGFAGFSTGNGYDRNGPLGPSLDQVLGGQLGKDNRFPTLVVAVEPGLKDYFVNGEVTSRMFDTISWKAAAQPVPAERDAFSLFTRMFAGIAEPGMMTGPTPEEMRRAAYKKSILDTVKSDLGDLTGRLGAGDRRRLDAHLVSIREIEQRTSSGAVMPTITCARPAAPPATISAVNERAQHLVDIFVMAARCDLTRFGSFMCGDGSGSDDGLARGNFVALPKGEHQYCHAGDGPNIGKFATFHLGFAARFLVALKSSLNPDGTNLLDSSLVYVSTELGDAAGHRTVNQPVILAGKLGGAITTGRHITYTNNRVADLMLTTLKLFGIDQASFGTSQGPLPGLTT